jgi:DNA-binding CsgD family transcriptional regulator
LFSIDTLTVLYLTGFTALGQVLVYLILLGKTESRPQIPWMTYQAVAGLGFLLLALGASGEKPVFYVLSSLLILSAYFARFVAIATVFQTPIARRHLIIGGGVIVFIGILFTWCNSLGAPLGSLETIVLLPLGVAAGLTAKYQRDQQAQTQSKPMGLIAYILWLECLVFGALSLGALAAIGQDYVNPSAPLSTLVTILFFVIQIVLHILWVIHSATDRQAAFGLAQRHQRAAHSSVLSENQRTRISKKSSANASVGNSMESGDSHLTAKELDVLRLVVAGKKNKEIADELQISEASVKVHKSRMTSKLGVKTLPELTLALQGLSAGANGHSSDVESSQSDSGHEEVKKD